MYGLLPWPCTVPSWMHSFVLAFDGPAGDPFSFLQKALLKGTIAFSSLLPVVVVIDSSSTYVLNKSTSFAQKLGPHRASFKLFIKVSHMQGSRKKPS